MAQHDMNIANQGFPAFRADLNSALTAIANNSSGATEPSTTFAYQWWYDTSTNALKMRNADNDAWIEIGTFNQTTDSFTPSGVTSDTISEGNSSVEVVDSGTGYVAVTVDGVETARFESGGYFGIGTTNPSRALEIANSSPRVRLTDTDGGYSEIYADAGNLDFYADVGNTQGASRVSFATDGTERMRIDSSGNVIIGNTSAQATSAVTFTQAGQIFTRVNNSAPLTVDRLSSVGDVISLQCNGAEFATIGIDVSRPYFASQNVGIRPSGSDVLPCNSAGATYDNGVDLGSASVRWDDVYATNGTIQTSDRNEKQDIAELDEAEQRVAQACKGLLRKFRWKDAVAEKGDDARIHFGIIAQDLQAAFEAEGLDAGKYALFISTTWWETTEEISAVEAVEATYDEEGNVLTEAVQAKKAYTRTDHYETLEEAPEGAVERTRLGVRYPELLAFIIAAL